MSNGSEEKRSVWAWVGCGCAVVALLGCAAIAIPIVLGLRVAKTMLDPQAVAEKARDLLALDSIPDGYRSELALSVPFIGDVVALSNDDRRFLYLRGARLTQDPALLDSGEVDLLELLRSGNVRVSHADTLDGGAFDIDEMRVNWVAIMGNAGIEGVHFGEDDDWSRGSGDRAELTSLMLLRCPGDRKRRARIAIWIGSVPDDDASDGAIGFEGSVADPDEIREFLSGFGLCRQS